MNVQWTNHAKERAVERSGLSADEIEKRVWNAWTCKGPGYFPGTEPNTVWVAVDGPRGRATAVCTLTSDGNGVLIVTIRESETAGQGERADKPLTHNPFAAALKNWRKS